MRRVVAGVALLLAAKAIAAVQLTALPTNDLRIEILRLDSALTLRWNSEPGQRFDLFVRSDLSAVSPWTALATNLSAVSPGNATDYRPGVSAGDAFYRVLRHAPFWFELNGTNFVYTDAQRSFTGIFIKPAAEGMLPAVVISHGAGGTVNGYSLAKARELAPWNLVVIAPTLTHSAGGETNPVNMGFCPENLARITACVDVLATMPSVDTNRMALFGHSMGAFATIGSAAVLNNRIRAAAVSAGGVIPDSAGTTNAAPTVTEGGPSRVPFLMVHCDGDPVVPAARSLLLQQVLNSNSVPTQRILISSNSIANQANWHNIHNDTAANALLLTNVHGWFRAQGMLP